MSRNQTASPCADTAKESTINTEEILAEQIKVTAVIGSDQHSSSWGKTFVFVVTGEIETHIYKMPGAYKKEVWSSTRHGSYQEITVSLPEGTKLKLFRDGGDKYGRRKEYRRRELENTEFFILDVSAEEIEVEGDGAHYTGLLRARMRKEEA